MNTILYIFFILLVFLIYLKTIKRKTSFSLFDFNNKIIKNNQWEYPEQSLLKKYVKPTDNVLQLGGNIGASCVLLDKILKKNINICVEPNKLLINTLKKNKKLNNGNFTIINGVITEKKDLKFFLGNSKFNYWDGHVSDNGNTKVKTYPLKSIKNIEKVNVLFADCEGCLESFFDEYSNILDQLRLVIYEKDNETICDYDKIYKLLKKYGFYETVYFNNMYVWVRNI